MAVYNIYDTKSDKIFNVVNYVILSMFFVIVLYPLIYVISASFSSAEAVISGKVWLLPVDFNIEGYKAVFKHRYIMTGYGNSIFYTFTGTLINVCLTVFAAYPLSRKDFYGRGFFMFLLTFTMLFNGGLIPNYLLVKSLGMMNTRWALIIPNAMAVWNVIITRTYFQNNIPAELLEAAQLDGCNDLKFVSEIVLPLSTPILAVISLFYAVGHWNAFFNAFIFLKNPKLFPLQIILREILIMNQIDMQMLSSDTEMLLKMQNLKELLKFSLIIVASLPVLVIYPLVQKYFVKGIMVGSLKG